MAFTSSIMAIAGTAMSMVQSIQQGNYAKGVAQTQAKNEEISAQLNMAENQRKLSQTLGTQVAQYGASGVDTGSGSVFDIGGSTGATSGENTSTQRFRASTAENMDIAAGNQKQQAGYGDAMKSMFSYVGSDKPAQLATNLFG